jgi:type IV fimbrial biogenesis protein FimT
MESWMSKGLHGNRRTARKSPSGFTLIELMIALAVGLILLVMAVPEFSAIVHKNRISATGSDLYASLSLARNEAIKRRSTVQVCPSSNGTSCRNDRDWSDGWIVLDTGSNTVIRSLDALERGVLLEGDNTVANLVQFNATGDALGTAGEFRICHADSIVRSRAVRVTAMGRVEYADRIRTDCNAGA